MLKIIEIKARHPPLHSLGQLIEAFSSCVCVPVCSAVSSLACYSTGRSRAITPVLMHRRCKYNTRELKIIKIKARHPPLWMSGRIIEAESSISVLARSLASFPDFRDPSGRRLLLERAGVLMEVTILLEMWGPIRNYQCH